MSKGEINKNFFGPLLILFLMGLSFAASADDCDAGTQYCDCLLYTSDAADE